MNIELNAKKDIASKVLWELKQGKVDSAMDLCKHILSVESNKFVSNTDVAEPIVVCLCGSTKFKDAFDEANYQETMRGKIVLSVGFFMHATGNKHGESIGATPEQKIALDELHKRKIDLADEVLILNIGGYIGSSTRSELEYAIAHNKIIRYLEEPSAPKGV